MASEPISGRDRLYQAIAHQLLEVFGSGRYKPGDRLPTERELAIQYNVSRPTIREAIIALEVQGIVEVRVGSGAYLKGLPSAGDPAAFNVSAFELTEARLLLEGEAAALAAAQITDEELATLAQLIDEIATENERNAGTEDADHQFHLTIARATRNSAIVNLIDNLWSLRAKSPETALLYAKARSANVKPVIDEHQVILDALRTRDPAKARAAMRAHLTAVLDSLLFATEEKAIEEARKASASKRARYERAIA
ncbi:GntR family transcriptional repressor for pyruvate dehydrogenase complex [Sphingobium sp. B1D7B]|uniref:FadR/GntR family transcriptional regulator n=1 Tax=Sphingobium TaxID=165695 RepID=UPI0015EB6309|nr:MULTISPECIES: FadR/GntR family transcriptional regulator [Sphingobium]MCW2351546.1 GntR family transcriptional repressor for pyruvate dehydrogenase complex [Sphingobium sp. B12D2B]MCW2363010.1 GntR family transcriptional repressor for pyruvate dehydrogenase complex [Sphingobium sp. B10D3B]MCW2365159.1 GntR family transcriptional repressor for pyruvate dehydrogenase complex [Sphingobium sp. B7D2B]MCW2370813.1 GntR family transcriptional repressor for pyruvate dehydrogenase complex [Sphingobiu